MSPPPGASGITTATLTLGTSSLWRSDSSGSLYPSYKVVLTSGDNMSAPTTTLVGLTINGND
ncbi:MAG: hypothetical protein ACRENE_16335 [Polyangiaceae bacterium]